MNAPQRPATGGELAAAVARAYLDFAAGALDDIAQMSLYELEVLAGRLDDIGAIPVTGNPDTRRGSVDVAWLSAGMLLALESLAFRIQQLTGESLVDIMAAAREYVDEWHTPPPQ